MVKRQVIIYEHCPLEIPSKVHLNNKEGENGNSKVQEVNSKE